METRPSDLILLGDSFGTGACLPDRSLIASGIAAGGQRVLNLSIGGHQLLDELATLKEYAPQFKSLVWLFYEGNDTSLRTPNSWRNISSPRSRGT
jgi:hypothetical protein